ncbi:serine hydrolase domain-containing protein [Nonomuraea rhizosphaerae]|uniref:serine hydrolase domain-containing protein n=1 Tax=Nonomuraea rhizosphaerae TaxID=2665663 RepID=UPI001C5FD61E|nr:serine hydrolase domain-containing protein [Nonomuraea rhizosphaerae]
MKTKLIGIVAAAAAVLSLTVTPAGASAELTPGAIDAYVGQAMEATGLPGLSVVVTHGDRVVHAAGYGHDSEGAVVTAGTPMRVASLSKSFTAMAVMTLVDEGKVALDGPVADQLPGFRMADPRAARITVRQLLDQTSGLSDTTVDMSALDDSTSLADYVGGLATSGLAAEPGTRWAYCNANYNVAARLVEVVGGQAFEDYLRQHVFEPLGMTRSAVRDEVVRPADGYNSLFGLWLSRPELPAFLDGSGSGGVITTATDMGSWLISQNGEGRQLVTARSLNAMHTPSKVQDYGMGWGEDGELLTHSGNLFTYTAVEAISPRTGYGFAVMTGSASLTDTTYAVMLGLAAMAEGRTPEVPGADRQLIELVLGLAGLAALGLGVLGVARSRRWAARRAGRARWRVAARLVPVLTPVVLLAAYPSLVSFLSNGRTITWEQVTYFAAPLTVTLVVAAVAGVVVAVARVVRLRSVPVTREVAQPVAVGRV